MLIKKSTINEYDLSNDFINNIFEDSAYFDIETTGLSSELNNIISITALIKEEKQNVIYQLFSASEDDENEILHMFISLIKNKKYIITYNGNSFDITFLNSKLKKYCLDFILNNLISIDLYRDVRCIKEKLDIENVKLKSIENHFGISRNDQLSGKDIIKLYKSYKIHNREEHMNLILEHNYEDVLYLPIIFDNILSNYDKIIYSNTIGLIKINNKNVTVNNKSIKIKATNITTYSLDYICNKPTHMLSYKKSSTTTKIDLFTSYYSDNNGNYIAYIKNDEFCLKSFNTINNLKHNIIPLIINDTVLYENLYMIIEKIVNKM